jgi:hypothetical protein
MARDPWAEDDAEDDAELHGVERVVGAAMQRRLVGSWRAHALGDATAAEDGLAACVAVARDARVTAVLAARAGSARARRLAAWLEGARLDAAWPVPPAPPGGAADVARRAVLAGDDDRARRERAWRERVAGAAGRAGALAAAWRAAPLDTWTRRRRAEGIEDEAALEARVDAALARGAAAWGETCAARAARLGVAALAPWDLWRDDDALAAALAPILADPAACVTALLAARGARPTWRRDEPAAGAGAATYAIDAPDDVRVVAPPPAPTLAALARELHEAGHALLATSAERGAPWVRRAPPAPWIDESVAAALVADLADPARLEGLGAPAALARAAAAEAAFAAELGFRLDAARFAFEREAFVAPVASVAELSARYWTHVARTTGIADPHGAPAWALVVGLGVQPGRTAAYAAAGAWAAELAAKRLDERAAWARQCAP